MTPEEIRAWTDKMEARRDELIRLIEQAFDGVSREGGVSLHEAYVIDNYGDEEERAAARLKDTDSRWQDVDLSQIHALDIPMFFMDPIGFRYYLPVFLVAELRSVVTWPPNDYEPKCAISWGHDEGSGYYVTHTFKHEMTNNYGLLDAKQRSVVRQVLEFFAEYGSEYDVEHEMRLRLNRYWSQFH